MMTPRKTVRELLNKGMGKANLRNIAGFILGLVLLFIFVFFIPLLPSFSYHLITDKKIDNIFFEVIEFRNWLGGLLIVIFFSILNRRNDESGEETQDS